MSEKKDKTKPAAGRHACLIIAHRQFGQLNKLLGLLDDERNDIYLHVDARAKDFSPETCRTHVKKAGFFIVAPMKVNWGEFSVVKAELILLAAAAARGPYAYYHMLSGADLPLKNQDEIHSFFNQNAGWEFIHFCTPAFDKRQRSRLSLYHLFPAGSLAERASLKIQQLAGVDRTKKNPYPLRFGAAWFSITDDLVKYVLARQNDIERYFSKGSCADEAFLQSLVAGSPFASRLYCRDRIDDYKACMRLIEWHRPGAKPGSPYVFHMSDAAQLKSSDRMFARKFDENIDRDIIDYVAALASQPAEKAK